MGNLFCSEHRIHRRFDLKGSSHGRSIHKSEEEIDENTTLKDLDLNFIFRLQKPWFRKLIWYDDPFKYSLLLLVMVKCSNFKLYPGKLSKIFLVGLHFGDELSTSSEGSCTSSSQGVPNLYDSFEHHESMDEPCLLDSTSRVPSKIINNRMQISLGMNMPARAEQVLPDGGGLGARPNGGEIYEVILHFGIIDILRDYDISKKLEHAYKSLQVDPTSISAVDPKLYSRRFRDFISRVFVEDD
ncbi:hypothetical protein HPP92_027200 [Vanilla planifolia]|uniref:1-phosphatidylinositol-4-phosphate 5-kinase n=1 Tax=Vanilla planifolia TaxID=51239 RepID=A0A835U5V6_VANPL|nr:hypothetical protein HPP92_027200 [Vanilla planifolia]